MLGDLFEQLDPEEEERPDRRFEVTEGSPCVPPPNMTPGGSVFEELATATWHRLLLSIQFLCSQGETTITDNNLLEIKRARIPGLRVYKAKGSDESEKGFDWEWWIRRRPPGRGFWRYSVQAKKLDLKTCRYASLRHLVRDTFQIDILESWAGEKNSIPLYCFYNHLSESSVLKKHWQCTLPLDCPQLGCTVAPLHEVRHAHDSWGGKTFEALHGNTSALPWRCLFCPNVVENSNGHLLAPPDYDPEPDDLPEFLTKADAEESVIDLPEEYYGEKLGGYPKRIMVIDTTEIA